MPGVQAQDGAAFHELLVAPLRERCTVEQVQGALAGDVPFLDVDVTAVFLDLENPSMALVRVALREEPEEGFRGLAPTFATLFPFPMEREEGGRRLNLLALAGGRDTGEGCPFAEDSSQEETVTAVARPLDATPQPALTRLAPPPGVQVIVSRSGGSRGEIEASVLLETDMPLVALLEHYRQQVLQPNWKVQQETIDEGLAAVTWTFRDEEDYPWFGVLLITPAEDGPRWVRLWMGGGAPTP